jgi:hypothetical protein
MLTPADERPVRVRIARDEAIRMADLDESVPTRRAASR